MAITKEKLILHLQDQLGMSRQESRQLLSLETYQAAENYTYPEIISSFRVEKTPNDALTYGHFCLCALTRRLFPKDIFSSDLPPEI